MKWRKNLWFKGISCVLAFSFLIANPSYAGLTDALKPPKTESHEMKQIEPNIAEAAAFPIIDPEKIIIAEKLGRVREIFKGQDGKLVINIQDAHCNFEAQTNISQILDALVKNGLRVVALEGSTGKIDPSIFTTFPDEDIRKEVASYFMKKGKINGAEYLAITSKNPPQLYGAETKEYYLANLATFLNTLDGRNEIKAACAGIKDALNKLKGRIYPKELVELDEKAPGNKTDEANLADYCVFLRRVALLKKAPVEKFLQLGLLYKAIDIENALDFNRVENERAGVIGALEKILTDKELDELFTRSLNFKSGRIEAAAYHIYLRTLAQAKAIGFDKYPNLVLYTNYLAIYEKIDSLALLKEISLLEYEVKDKLFTTTDQRTLDKLSKNIRLLENMLDISMSREDVEYYQKNKETFRSQAFIDFIKTQAKKYKEPFGYNPNFALIDKYLPDLENFYRIAETRDDAIIENTLKKMDEEAVEVVALITGGYHTEGIAQRLRNRGISYVVIAPRITKLDKDNPYLEILSGETAHLKEGASSLNTSNKLSPTSLNAKDPLVDPETEAAFSAEAALIVLSGAVYTWKSKNPNITAAELEERLTMIRERWLDFYTSRMPAAQAARLTEAAGAIEFDLANIETDARGRYYIPVTILGERKFIRYYNLAADRPKDVEIEARYSGEAANVGIQILSEEQYRRVMGPTAPKSKLAKAETPTRQEIPKKDIAPFRRQYQDWVNSLEGINATPRQKIEKLAQIFLEGMHGLRGDPDNWLLEIVKSLNPDDTGLHAAAERTQREIQQRLAEACGPQALYNALYRPEAASPVFTEAYSSPSRMSWDLSSVLLTAIDMSELGGRVAGIDEAGRLYHTAFALAQLGGMTGVRVNTDARGRPDKETMRLLKILTINGHQRFIAHVRNRAEDTEGNHYVEVEVVTDTEVTYRDNGEPQTIPTQEFLNRWTGNILVDSQIADELGRAQEVMKSQGIGYELLDPDARVGAEALKAIKGACGVITTVGGSFAGHLGSELLMEYRGRDNQGWDIIDEFGSRTVKVQGASEAMARAIYMRGQGLDERALYYLDIPQPGQNDALRTALIKLKDAKALNSKDRDALHNTWRMLSVAQVQQITKRVLEAREKLVTRQKITQVTHSNFSASEMYPIELDANGKVNKQKAVGPGKFGFLPAAGRPDFFGGATYTIQNNIPDLIEKLKLAHDLDIAYIKYFIKFELEQGIIVDQTAKGQHPEHIEAKVEELLRVYDRLIDKVIRRETLTGKDQQKWDEIQGLLNGRDIKVPALFSKDPVRNLFRLQAALIGTFLTREEWKTAVDKKYQAVLRGYGISEKEWRKRDWLTDWREEARLNIAGRAFEALTAWFQDEFVVPDSPDLPKNHIIRKFGIESGVVDSITLGHMYIVDFIGGHDRWATTGSDEEKDAQSHGDTGALCALSAGILTKILQLPPAQGLEPAVRMREFLEKAKAARTDAERGMTRVVAHNGDLNPDIVSSIREFLEARGYDFTTEDGKLVLTDTKVFIVFWEYVRDAVYLDTREGRVSSDTNLYIDIENKNNLLEGKIKTAEGQDITLAALWNEIVRLAKRAKRDMPLDEAALRVALTVFGRDSEIAINTRSLHMPDKHIAVSHDRPLYVVIKDVIKDGKKVDVKYQVTSDPSSALKLWDNKQVDEDIKKLNAIEEQRRRRVNDARAERNRKLASLAGQTAALVKAADAYTANIRTINKDIEAQKDVIRAKYEARVITLKGFEKVVSISKRFNEETGEFEIVPEFTDFMGNKLDSEKMKKKKEITDKSSTIPIDIADKGRFRTSAEKHIDEIPGIVLQSMATYIKPDGTVDMSMEVIEGLLKRYGVDIAALKAQFGENLEGLKRIFITGIGSSERDALCVTRLFKTLLPDVDVIPIGPGKLVSENQKYDSRHDLMVGISWSGSTALTNKALVQAKDGHGVMTISLTGKPESDIGTLTSDSGGTVHVKTGEEKAIFTTKGFLGILYDLGILGVQLSQLRDSALREQERQRVQADRRAIVEGQKDLPDILTGIIEEDKRLDLEDPDSWAYKEGERYKNGGAGIIIGSKHNNPIILEGELKDEETRWILGRAYDYDDDTFWNILEFLAKAGLRWPVVIQATDESRMHKAMAIIQRCKELGLDFIVETFDEDMHYTEDGAQKNHREELQRIQKEAGVDPKENGGDGRGRIQVYTVSKVHPALQGIVDVPFFFKFAVAHARSAGLSDLDIDSSANLAKSVTVKGIVVPGILYEMFQYLSKMKEISIEQIVEQYKGHITRYWQNLATSVDKAIERLPLVYDDVTKRCFPYMTGAEKIDHSKFDKNRLKGLGGPEGVKKLVIISEEVADAHTAAAMAAGPLGYVEWQTTGGDIFEQPTDYAGNPLETKTKGNIAINGEYYAVTYNFRTSMFIIQKTKDGKAVGNPLEIKGVKKTITKKVAGEMKEITYAEVDQEQFKDNFARQAAEFFNKEFNITANETEGLVFEAVKPSLAGVNVIVHSPDDYDLHSDIDENTVVVVVRRSNNRPWGRNAQVPDIEDPVKGRSEKQAEKPQDSLGEDNILRVLNELPEGVPVFTIADEGSGGVRQRGQNSLGEIALPNGLDATSAVAAYYMSLLSLGVYLGWAKNVPNMDGYQKGLISSVELARQVVADKVQIGKMNNQLVSLRTNIFDQQYETVYIVGGGQDYSSALAWAVALHRIAGVTAEALPVDEFVHGPLAAVRNAIRKFLNQILKQGVNPRYNPNPKEAPASKEQDTLVVILGTDSRTLQASVVDANRVLVRSGRVVFVVKETDRNEKMVKALEKQGAFILTVPNSPNELTSVSQMTLAAIFANELNRSKGPEFSFARVTAGMPIVEAMVEPPLAEKAQLMTKLRLEDKGLYYETAEGGRIAKDVDLRKIDETAVIEMGSIVRGVNTVIGRNVRITENSVVINSRIKEGSRIDRSNLNDVDVEKNAVVSDSILRTEKKKKKWRYADSEYGVDNDRTVVGEGAKITGQSTLINTRVGKGSEVDDSDVSHSEIGRKNKIKSAKVVLAHAEDLVEIIGPTEVQEAWLGWGLTINNMAFVTGVFPNKVLALDSTDGQVVPEFIDGIPNVSPVGEYAIFSDYQGEISAREGEEITRITGDESSEHGTAFVKPSSIVAPETRLIALARQLNLTTWEHAMEGALTVINPFSVAAHYVQSGGMPTPPGQNGRETWGQTLPGEARHGLSLRDTTPGWTLTYSPHTVISLMRHMVDKIRAKAELDGKDPDEAVKRLDDFPEKMLKTGIVVCRRSIDSLNTAIQTEPDAARKAKLEDRKRMFEQALRLYQAHLDSRAWEFRNGQFVHEWSYDDSLERYRSPQFDALLARLVTEGLIPDHGAYRQVMMSEILGTRRSGRDVAGRAPPRPDITKTDMLRPRTKETFIGPEVEVHPTAIILPGTRLTGKTKIGANTVVWGSHLHDVEVGDDSEILNCMADGVKMGNNNRHLNSRMSNSRFGNHVKSTRALIERSSAANGTEFDSRAVVIGSKCAGTIGGPFIESTVDTEPTEGATNVTDHHMAAAVRNADFPAIEAQIGGVKIYFPNVTNVGGGSSIGKVGAKERVVIESAFIASDTDVLPGARIGFCAFVKNGVGENEEVLPFTFKKGAGLENDELGGILDMPGVVLRHLISKTKAALPPEKRYLVDKLMVAKIKETLEICKGMLADPTKNPGYTEDQLRRGIERFERHLREGRWEMENHDFTRGRWRRISPEGVGRVEWLWVPKEPVSAPPPSFPPDVHVIPGCKRPTIADVQVQAPLAEGIGHAALLFASSGIIGFSAADQTPGSLMILRDYLRRVFMLEDFGPISLQVLQSRLDLKTITPETHRVYFGESEEFGVYVGLADGITPALQNKPGCVMWAVAGPTVKMLREPPSRCSTDVLAVHIPNRENLTDAETALLTPNRDFENDSTELLETLIFAASKNGISAGTPAQPDLRGLRVYVTARAREEGRRGYLDQLRRYGLEIVEISSVVSPVSYILNACLPPRPDERLEIFLGGAGTPQSVAAIHFVHGITNGWVAASPLSNHVNDKDQSALPGTPVYKGLGGQRRRALGFDEQELTEISRFTAGCSGLSHPPSAEEIMRGTRGLTVRLLENQPPSRGVLIPVNGDPVLRDSVTGDLLPGIVTDANGSRYATFNVHAGTGWTQTYEVQTPVVPRAAKFNKEAFDVWCKGPAAISAAAELDEGQEPPGPAPAPRRPTDVESEI